MKYIAIATSLVFILIGLFLFLKSKNYLSSQQIQQNFYQGLVLITIGVGLQCLLLFREPSESMEKEEQLETRS